MKRTASLIASILAAVMTLALISCGETAPEIDDTPEKTTESMSESEQVGCRRCDRKVHIRNKII